MANVVHFRFRSEKFDPMAGEKRWVAIDGLSASAADIMRAIEDKCSLGRDRKAVFTLFIAAADGSASGASLADDAIVHRNAIVVVVRALQKIVVGPGALVPASPVPAAPVPEALVTGALIPPALVPGALVPARRGTHISNAAKVAMGFLAAQCASDAAAAKEEEGDDQEMKDMRRFVSDSLTEHAKGVCEGLSVEQSKKRPRNDSKVVCFRCNGLGHMSRECTLPEDRLRVAIGVPRERLRECATGTLTLDDGKRYELVAVEGAFEKDFEWMDLKTVPEKKPQNLRIPMAPIESAPWHRDAKRVNVAAATPAPQTPPAIQWSADAFRAQAPKAESPPLAIQWSVDAFRAQAPNVAFAANAFQATVPAWTPGEHRGARPPSWVQPGRRNF